MKISKKVRIFLPVFILMISVSAFTISAGAISEAYFTLNGDGAVNKGENVSVNLTFSSTENIGEINAKVAYDSSALEFTGGNDATGGGGIIFIKSNGNGSTDCSYTLNFKGISQSTGAQLNIITCTINSQDGSMIGSPTAYANITVVDNGSSVSDSQSSSDSDSSSKTETTTAPKEDESSQSETTTEKTEKPQPRQVGKLRSLTVDNGELQPEFSPDVYEYTVNVDFDVTNVEIDASASNPSDYIWYSGSSECQVGENVRTISVSDSFGNQTLYTVKIIRADENSVTVTKQPEKTMHIPQSKSSEQKSAFEKDKNLINSALIIILIVLVIALVVIIFWIRNKMMSNKSGKKK